jgi:CheY-like chemotaxis protein
VRDLEAPIATGSGKILIMDDEALIRDLVQEMLSLLGYEVVVARDGIEAIEQHRLAGESARPFDVVVMDLTVPGGLGGSETIRKLRQIDPQIRAIVSSGYSNDPIMADYAKYGFCGVVAKPYGVINSHILLLSIIDLGNVIARNFKVKQIGCIQVSRII